MCAGMRPAKHLQLSSGKLRLWMLLLWQQTSNCRLPSASSRPNCLSPMTGHYWVGRVVDAGTDHFLGKGVLKQVTRRHETINDTMFTEGDIAIAIEWFDRTEEDGDDGLHFEKWASPHLGKVALYQCSPVLESKMYLSKP